MSNAARVPLMVTNAMRARLRGLGLSEPEIDELSPSDAWDRLGGMPDAAPAPAASPTT